MFPNELAYMCNFDKGGETVTAVGLQYTLQWHIFWVASNAGSKAKVVEFLNSLLIKILHRRTDPNVPLLVAEVASQCISFAAPRVKKYRSHLRPLIRRCSLYLATQERVGVSSLKSDLLNNQQD